MDVISIHNIFCKQQNVNRNSQQMLEEHGETEKGHKVRRENQEKEELEKEEEERKQRTDFARRKIRLLEWGIDYGTSSRDRRRDEMSCEQSVCNGYYQHPHPSASIGRD
ncbi:hypothetical protein BsWGS_12456 [Bradybaena similaris]